MKIQPSFVIVLELSDQEVTHRLKTRKIDPVTGSIYTETAPSMTIQNRLQPLTNSHPKKIEIRLVSHILLSKPLGLIAGRTYLKIWKIHSLIKLWESMRKNLLRIFWRILVLHWKTEAEKFDLSSIFYWRLKKILLNLIKASFFSIILIILLI